MKGLFSRTRTSWRWQSSSLVLLLACCCYGQTATDQPASVPPFTCLAEAASSVASDNVTYVGCVPEALVVVKSTPANVTNASSLVPLLNDTLRCASACMMADATRGGNMRTNATIAIMSSRCYCLAPLSGRAAGRIGPGANWSDSCDSNASMMRVYNISVPCPVNISQCGQVDGCAIVGDCCVASDSSSSGLLPALYLRTMVQWVAIIVIVLAVIEGVVYGCIRRNGLLRREDAPSREPDEVKELTERLMGDITDNNSDIFVGVADDCSICLEPLANRRSKVLPCGHRLHATCLEQFIAHAISNTDSVLCPMCRAALVVTSNNGDRTLQVAVHVNAVVL